MSEEKAAAEQASEAAPDTSGLALDLAMEEARADPSLHDDVSAFLRNQNALVDIQKHHLRKQFRLSQWEKRLGVFLRLATAVVGVAVATALGATVWDASQSKGLIIEPFSVPPEMAERGLSSEVVASQVLDKLTAMTKTESSRAVQSYANNWGNDIKMEIPETGISVGELRRFLRNWLGHDIRISGEVYRTETGIAVTARAGGEGATFTGKESDLDSLVQQAAEHVYEITQPYRYANYLDRNYDPKGRDKRVAKATAIYHKLIAGDDPKERVWAWNGLGTIEFNYRYDNRKAAAYYRRAMAAMPEFTLVYYALAARNGPLGQEEEEYQNIKQASRLLQGDVPELNPRYARSARLSADARALSFVGDFGPAIPIAKAGAELPDEFSVLARGTFTNAALSAIIRQHDFGALRGYLRDLGWVKFPDYLVTVRYWHALERQQLPEWRDFLRLEPLMMRRIADAVGTPIYRARINAFDGARPYFAMAHAQLGEFAEAEKLLAPLPQDNAIGVRARAVVAELEGDHANADLWFARSEAQTPSLPLTDLWWGQSLLRRGNPDAAIAKFALANKKGPKFADPLEGWGEALMAKNQSHRALAKFAEAERYAPNWGRLHLKWGEALAYSGNKVEAAKRFARAAQLDLTPSEKAELARHP